MLIQEFERLAKLGSEPHILYAGMPTTQVPEQAKRATPTPPTDLSFGQKALGALLRLSEEVGQHSGMRRLVDPVARKINPNYDQNVQNILAQPALHTPLAEKVVAPVGAFVGESLPWLAASAVPGALGMQMPSLGAAGVAGRAGLRLGAPTLAQTAGQAASRAGVIGLAKSAYDVATLKPTTPTDVSKNMLLSLGFEAGGPLLEGVLPKSLPTVVSAPIKGSTAAAVGTAAEYPLLTKEERENLGETVKQSSMGVGAATLLMSLLGGKAAFAPEVTPVRALREEGSPGPQAGRREQSVLERELANIREVQPAEHQATSIHEDMQKTIADIDEGIAIVKSNINEGKVPGQEGTEVIAKLQKYRQDAEDALLGVPKPPQEKQLVPRPKTAPEKPVDETARLEAAPEQQMFEGPIDEQVLAKAKAVRDYYNNKVGSYKQTKKGTDKKTYKSINEDNATKKLDIFDGVVRSMEASSVSEAQLAVLEKEWKTRTRNKKVRDELVNVGYEFPEKTPKLNVPKPVLPDIKAGDTVYYADMPYTVMDVSDPVKFKLETPLGDVIEFPRNMVKVEKPPAPKEGTQPEQPTAIEEAESKPITETQQPDVERELFNDELGQRELDSYKEFLVPVLSGNKPIGDVYHHLQRHPFSAYSKEFDKIVRQVTNAAEKHGKKVLLEKTADETVGNVLSFTVYDEAAVKEILSKHGIELTPKEFIQKAHEGYFEDPVYLKAVQEAYNITGEPNKAFTESMVKDLLEEPPTREHEQEPSRLLKMLETELSAPTVTVDYAKVEQAKKDIEVLDSGITGALKDVGFKEYYDKNATKKVKTAVDGLERLRAFREKSIEEIDPKQLAYAERWVGELQKGFEKLNQKYASTVQKNKPMPDTAAPAKTARSLEEEAAAIRKAHETITKKLVDDTGLKEPDGVVLAKDVADEWGAQQGLTPRTARKKFKDVVKSLWEGGGAPDIHFGPVRNVKNSLGRIEVSGREELLGTIRIGQKPVETPTEINVKKQPDTVVKKESPPVTPELLVKLRNDITNAVRHVDAAANKNGLHLSAANGIMQLSNTFKAIAKSDDPGLALFAKTTVKQLRHKEYPELLQTLKEVRGALTKMPRVAEILKNAPKTKASAEKSDNIRKKQKPPATVKKQSALTRKELAELAAKTVRDVADVGVVKIAPLDPALNGVLPGSKKWGSIAKERKDLAPQMTKQAEVFWDRIAKKLPKQDLGTGKSGVWSGDVRNLPEVKKHGVQATTVFAQLRKRGYDIGNTADRVLDGLRVNKDVTIGIETLRKTPEVKNKEISLAVLKNAAELRGAKVVDGEHIVELNCGIPLNTIKKHIAIRRNKKTRETFIPIQDVSVNRGSVPKHIMDKLPDDIKKGLAKIDNEAILLTDRIKEYTLKHGSRAEMNWAQKKVFDSMVEDLDAVGEKREAWREAVDIEMGDIAKHKYSRSILNNLIKGKPISDLVPVLGRDGTIIAKSYVTPVTGKKIHIDVVPEMTKLDENILRSHVGSYARKFGVIRDVFGAPIATRLRNSLMLTQNFERDYQEWLYKIVKPIVKDTNALERVTYLLEGKSVRGATETDKQVAGGLREWYNHLFGQFDIDANRFLNDYAPRIRRYGSIIDAYGTKPPKELSFFAEFERSAGDILFPRETNALTAANTYLRLGARKKFIQPAFDVIDQYMTKRVVGVGTPKPALSNVAGTKIMHEDRAQMLQELKNNMLHRPVWEERLMQGMVDSMALTLKKELGSKYKNVFDEFSAFTTHAIYINTLGFNLTTVAKQLTQQALSVGTLTGNPATGLKYWGKAVKALRTKTGRDVLKYCTVLQNRVYQEGIKDHSKILMGARKALEDKAFYLFEKADRVNVSISYMMKVLHALENKKSFAEAVQSANTFAADTQFLYGFDSPMFYKSSGGRLAGVLTSYPVNFVRLMHKLLTGDPKGVAKIASTLGTLYATMYGLGALTGINFSSENPHSTVSGLLPLSFVLSGRGSLPIDTVRDVYDTLRDKLEGSQKEYEQSLSNLQRDLTTLVPFPMIQLNRVIKALDASANGGAVYDNDGKLSYTMSPGETLRGIVGPTVEASKRRKQHTKIQKAIDTSRITRQKAIDAYLEGDTSEFNRLQRKLKDGGFTPIRKSDVKQAIEYKNMTALERHMRGLPKTYEIE